MPAVCSLRTMGEGWRRTEPALSISPVPLRPAPAPAPPATCGMTRGRCFRPCSSLPYGLWGEVAPLSQRRNRWVTTPKAAGRGRRESGALPAIGGARLPARRGRRRVYRSASLARRAARERDRRCRSFRCLGPVSPWWCSTRGFKDLGVCGERYRSPLLQGCRCSGMEANRGAWRRTHEGDPIRSPTHDDGFRRIVSIL